jgi:hypothetical protein
MVTVYLLDLVFPSASPSVSFLFGFLVPEFTVDEIKFICIPRPLECPTQKRRMKLAIGPCFPSSPLSQVVLFREELRPELTSPPDHIPDSRTAIAIQPPPSLTFSMDYGPCSPPSPCRLAFHIRRGASRQRPALLCSSAEDIPSGTAFTNARFVKPSSGGKFQSDRRPPCDSHRDSIDNACDRTSVARGRAWYGAFSFDVGPSRHQSAAVPSFDTNIRH